jgi:dTDP-4-amino-4,6-dideoxygalactose transaminase
VELARRAGQARGVGLNDGMVTFLSSARAGVFHAVRHFGLREPDKILVPSYHCGVEIEAILHAGASLEYYSVGNDMMVRTDDVARHIGPDVKALFLIHYWGFPQDIDAIVGLCKKHNLLLIEDCAHALFSSHGRHRLGSSGDASIFSLPKTIAVPDGGILLSNRESPELSQMETTRSWAALKMAARSQLEHLRSSHQRPVSWLADLLLSVKGRGRAQEAKGLEDYGETPLTMYNRGISCLSKSVFQRSPEERVYSRRRDNYLQLLICLEDVDEIDVAFPELDEGVCPLFLPIVVDSRSDLERHLSSNRIDTFVFGRTPHPTLDGQQFTEATHLANNVLGLPIHQDLHEDDMSIVAQRIKEWVSGRAHKAGRTK